jgi:sporulation protein YqfC
VIRAVDLQRKLKQQMSDLLELPGDVMMDFPRIVMLGSAQVVVENHRGITKYNSEVISISISGGEIVIKGSDLKLRNVLPEEIYVEGRIKSLSFEK